MSNGISTRVSVSSKTQKSDAIVVALWQWPESKIPTFENLPLAPALKSLADAKLIKGQAGSSSIHLVNGDRLIVIGLGDKEKSTPENFRKAGGALAKLVRKNAIASVAVHPIDDPAALVTGFILAGFVYTDYKTSVSYTKPAIDAVKLNLTGEYDDETRAEIEQAVTIAESQNYARTIASRPPNDINPPSLAKVATALAKEVGLGLTVFDEKKMATLGMGGILAVGAGSNRTPPRLIVLDHNPKGTKKGQKPLLVVGKTITFDTGGISIKPAANMQKMVFDKCGGMAVLGLMRALALLQVPRRVIGILAAAENHISETAYRPGDILKMYNGVTVEVTNTDAEGRLVLADALAWGIETYKPEAVVDLATLTGAVVIALGKTMAGSMGHGDALFAELQQASTITGEAFWPLPLTEEMNELMESDRADIINAGPPHARPMQGAVFLSYFVPKDLPWQHLDIAGVADTDKELPYYAKGATGWGVRTLVEWILNA